LGEVCEFLSGGTPSKARADYWQGDIAWVSPKDMHGPVISTASDRISEAAVAGSATRLVRPPAVLVVVRSGILARCLPVAECAAPVAFNQDIKALVPIRGLVEPAFLAAFLRFREPEILQYGVKKGATAHSMRSKYLENLAIALPPLPEQRRIAGILREQLAAVERARASLVEQTAAISALPGALLRRAFAGGL
jgi:type I restriction enzyme S subunit